MRLFFNYKTLSRFGRTAAEPLRVGQTGFPANLNWTFSMPWTVRVWFGAECNAGLVVGFHLLTAKLGWWSTGARRAATAGLWPGGRLASLDSSAGAGEEGSTFERDRPRLMWKR